MPSRLTAKLSNVAAEYLRNHDELEAARELFLGERAKLLDSFGDIMREAALQRNQALQLNQEVPVGRRNDRDGLFDVDISGEYVAKRAPKNKRSSGYSTGLGSYLGHIGAQTLLWFQLKLNARREKRLVLVTLENALGTGVRAISEGAWLYIRTTAQSPSNIDMEALDGAVRQLPEQFAKADAWIAERFEE